MMLELGHIVWYKNGDMDVTMAVKGLFYAESKWQDRKCATTNRKADFILFQSLPLRLDGHALYGHKASLWPLMSLISFFAE